jgi:hypothetical protein
LVFICPVLMKEVPCGHEGAGFLIQIPTQTLRTIIPILKYGILFAKVALATQGLGACVPDLGALLPDMNNDYLNNLTASLNQQIQSSIQDKIDGTLHDISTTLDSYSEDDEAAALAVVRGILQDTQGASTNLEDLTGLKLVKSRTGDRSMWVSEEVVPIYRDR